MEHNLNNGTQKKDSGYMLVEILVSLSIFALIVVSTTGALLSIIDANSKAQTLKIAMDNLNNAVESMAREIRTGKNYECYKINGINKPCTPSGTSEFSYIDQKGVKKDYFLNSSVINHTTNGSTFSLTDSSVNISVLKFYVVGAGAGGGQPRVVIVIKGVVESYGSTGTSFTIQTTVTQRLRDAD